MDGLGAMGVCRARLGRMRLMYKSFWLAFVLLLLAGEVRADTVALTVVFLFVIVICIVATPWEYKFGGREMGSARSE